MKVLLNLCLLFSLISPEIPYGGGPRCLRLMLLLTCHNCANTTGTECRETESQKCESKNHVCKNLIFRSNVFLKNEKVNKGCIAREWCHPVHSSLTTSGGGFLEIRVECCKTDKCNSKDLKFSSEPMKPTRLECVGCNSRVRDKESCEGTEVVKCHGEQTKCFSMKIDYFIASTRRIRSATFTAKGCATPEMCDGRKLATNFLLKEVMIGSVTVNCTNPV